MAMPFCAKAIMSCLRCASAQVAAASGGGAPGITATTTNVGPCGAPASSNDTFDGRVSQAMPAASGTRTRPSLVVAHLPTSPEPPVDAMNVSPGGEGQPTVATAANDAA